MSSGKWSVNTRKNGMYTFIKMYNIADHIQETNKSIFTRYKNGIFHYMDENDYPNEFHGIQDDINNIYQLYNNIFLEECFYVTMKW